METITGDNNWRQYLETILGDNTTGDRREGNTVLVLNKMDRGPAKLQLD